MILLFVCVAGIHGVLASNMSFARGKHGIENWFGWLREAVLGEFFLLLTAVDPDVNSVFGFFELDFGVRLLGDDSVQEQHAERNTDEINAERIR